MPDYRRAWHRGGACLFKAVTARAHDLPARDVDVLRAAKHRDVRERPRPRIRPKKKPGLFENGTADQITRATCHLSHVTCHMLHVTKPERFLVPRLQVDHFGPVIPQDMRRNTLRYCALRPIEGKGIDVNSDGGARASPLSTMVIDHGTVAAWKR
jgi:hypothetical protein